MVFESVVAELLNRFLGDYVENLDSTQLKIGIWGGDVVLRNLILKQNALAELDLPVKTIYGQLGKLVLKIPWKNLYSAPVEIEIERLFLLAVPNTDIVYNSEKEERWAREAKQAELTRVEEQKQKQREAANPKQTNDTFVEKLTTNIIKNVQIRIRDIHIRYEDKSDAQIYSMGATLSSLTVVSTDENWIQKISTGDVAHIFKVLQLESLAVYWNTPTEIYSTQSFENICEKLEETIVSSTQTPPNFKYILGPICSDARLRLHPKPENDDPKFILPKILLNIEMKTLQIAINEPQYQCIVLFMGSMERMKRGAMYRKYRPAVPFKGHAKEWWRFAYNSVLEFEVRRRRQNWNIDHVMNYRKMCKDYAAVYKEKMLLKKVPADLTVRCQYFEDKLDLFNIVVARQQVEIEVANQIEIAKQEAAEKSWFGGWFGGSKNKTEDSSSNDIIKQFEKAMTPEEKKKLYQAIDYTDSNVPIEFPKEYVDMVSAFALHGLVVEIRNGDEKRVLSAHLKGVKCQVQRRPRADAFKLAAKVDAFTVYGSKQNDIRPILVSSRQVNDSSLMDFQFETNPLHGDCGQRISFKSCPIQIVYDAKTIINVTKIFEKPKDVSLDYISAVTNMKMQDLKEKSLFGMQYAIEQHTKLDININIASPYIVIPYGGFYTGNEPVLIANLGELKLETPESEGYRDIQSRKLENISDEDLFTEMQKYSYEQYILSLNNFQVIFSLPSAKLTEELESGNVELADIETNLHLIESTSLKINIGRCLITDDPRLPKIKVSGEIPTVQISASDFQLLMIIALANSIPLPVSQEESDQQVTAATSIASSLSTIPTMASQFVTNNIIKTSYEIKKETTDDLIQLTEIEVSFIAKRIDLILSKHHAEVELHCIKEKLEANDGAIKFGESKKKFQFSIIGMEFEMTKQTFNQDIVARLGGINYKHFLQNEIVNVLTTPRGDDDDAKTLNEEDFDYLFSVTFSTVDKKSPEFATKYQHCEQILFVELHKIMVILHLDGIKEALKFMNVIQQEMNRIFYVPPSDSDETVEYKTLSHVKRENVLATINENIEMNIKQGLKRRQRKKKSHNVRRIETTLLKIDAQLGEVNVTLQNSIRKLSTFAISGLYLNVDMKKSIIQVSAALKNISIIDPNPLNIHSQILTTIGDETLNLSVIYYTKDIEYETDTDLDLSINVRVGAIRLVFLNWFVASQLRFLSNFQEAEQAIFEASAAAAEQAKQNVQNALEKSLRMKLNVIIKAPDIIVPIHSKSLNALLIDMGVLTLSNKITDTYTKVEDGDTKNEDETEEGQEQHHILVEELRISLENIQISRIHINDANDYSNMNECSILSPTNIQLTVQRNLTPNSKILMPDIDIFGRLEKVQLNLSTTDYKTLMLILSNNLTEGDEFTKEEPKNVPAKPPPKIQQQVSVKTIIEKDVSQTLVSESEIHKTSKTSNVFLQFKFTLHTLDISLFNAKCNSSIDSIERENGLAQFIMSVLSIKGRILHDQTIIASIVLVDCSLDDIRKETNDDDSIRRLLKRNVHNERLLMNYLQNQPKGMLDLTYQQQGEHMFVDLRVFSFELIMAVDYLMLLLQFFTPDLDLEHNEEHQSHVQHLTTATATTTKEIKPTPISQQPPPPSNTKTMTVNIRVEQPDIIFVESTLSKNVNAIVLNCEINMKARLSGENHQVINGSMKDLTLYTCKFSRRNQQKNVLHSILKPVCLSIAGSTPAGDDITQGLHVDVIVTDVHLSVSPATIELVNRTLNALTTVKSEKVEQNKHTERDLGNLWDPLIFKDNDFWYLRAEEAEEISEEWMKDISDDPLQNANKIKRNEMCILNVPSIVVTLEAGVGNQTLPMILLETKLSGMIGNWSSQMYVDCSLSLQINYYNSILAVWEPLIEPKEYSTDGITRKTEPWEIKFEMQIKNNDLQSPLNPLDLNDEDRIDEDTNLYQTSQQCILIESKDNLEITISKTCFEVINNLSKAFSNAIQIHDDMVWNVDSAPYSVINDTGVDLVLNIEGTAFMVCDSPNCRQVQIGFGGKVSLELREIEDIKKFTESKCIKTIEQKEDEGLPKIVHLQVNGARNTIDLPISRADKRYFPLTMEKDPTSKWGIISDIKIINGCTTVCLRSIVQVHNHFDHALDVFYMNENGKSVELIDTISAQGNLNLPLNAVYSPTSEIFFGLRGYTISNTPFIWKDLQLNLAMVKLLECRPKDNKTSKNSFFIRAMGEIEQVYNETTSKHTMISVCYNVHLRPTVSFRNCLPFAIVLCISGSIEETVIEPGHVMLLPTVEPDVNEVVIRLDNYLEKTWSCKRKIQNNSPEFSVWAFDSYDSTLKMTLDLGVHKSFHQGSILLALYCPFWMINKTEMMLTYRNNSEDSLNVLYHPENFKGPILFSFNSKNFFGKKKASIRVENGEWSNKFSIDVAGSSGVVTCKYNGVNYQIGVQNQLTYNGLTKQIVFTPLYILINNAPFAIETQEIDRPGDKWITVEENSCTPLWPKGSKDDKLLRIRIIGTQETSAPFLISEVHATLLKLPNKYGGVNVDIQINEGARYITFSRYEAGSAPGLIINHTKYPIKYWEKESVNVRNLESYNCILYTWENPSSKRILQCASEYIQPAKMEIENDLRQDGIGEFFVNDPDLNQKVLVYWVSFLDGLQRVLLFTDQQNIAQNAQTAGKYEPISQEINISLHGVGLSLVNNILRKDVMYLGIASSGILWETAKLSSTRFKPLSQHDCLLIEAAYQHHLQQLSLNTTVKNSIVTLGPKLEVDFYTEMILKPNKRRLRRTFQTGFWMQLKTSEHQLQLHAKINRLQIDNQLYDCIFPVVLAPIPPPKSVAADTALKPFAELSVVQRIMKHSPVQQFKYFKLLIQEFHVKVDLGFVNAILECIQGKDPSEAETLEYFQTDLKLVDQPLHSHVSTLSLQDQKNFYDLLHFSPLKIHISFSLQTGSTSSASSDSTANQSAIPEFLSVVLQGIGVTLTDMHDVVFRLAYFERNFMFYTQKQLISEATQHYVGQLVKQAYVLVLGLDVIGNPYGLVLGISKGVEDLFYEPFQGAIQGPGEFAEGLVLGVRSLFGHTVGGAAGAVSRITGAMGKGIAALSFDEDFQKRRREQINKRPANLQEGLARSGKGLVMGVFDGVTGVFSKPISGAKEQGVEGFFKGLGKGAIGLVARPTAGVVDFASGSLEAVKRCAEGEETGRLRAPRFISNDRRLTPYCFVEAEGNKLLMELEKGKYSNTDVYVYHVWIIQRKEILLLTDKRIAYITHNDIFGGWQVDWSYTWHELQEAPKINDVGMQVIILEQKKKFNLFGSNSNNKFIPIHDEKLRELLIIKIDSIFNNLMSASQSSLNRPSI